MSLELMAFTQSMHAKFASMHVNLLSLRTRQLSCQPPQQLFDYSSLRHLDISCCGLYLSSPRWFSRVHLKHLVMDFTHFSISPDALLNLVRSVI